MGRRINILRTRGTDPKHTDFRKTGARPERAEASSGGPRQRVPSGALKPAATCGTGPELLTSSIYHFFSFYYLPFAWLGSSSAS